MVHSVLEPRYEPVAPCYLPRAIHPSVLHRSSLHVRLFREAEAAADAAAPLEEDAPQKLEAAADASLSAAAPDFVPSTIVPAGDDTDSIATPLHGEDSAAAQARYVLHVHEDDL